MSEWLVCQIWSNHQTPHVSSPRHIYTLLHYEIEFPNIISQHVRHKPANSINTLISLYTYIKRSSTFFVYVDVFFCFKKTALFPFEVRVYTCIVYKTIFGNNNNVPSLKLLLNVWWYVSKRQIINLYVSLVLLCPHIHCYIDLQYGSYTNMICKKHHQWHL